MGLHEDETPYADVKDLSWVKVLSDDQIDYLNNPDFNINVSTGQVSKMKEPSLAGKAFEAWDRTKNPFPCAPNSSPETEGIIFIKIPKTSSTTLARITNRIAGREAERQLQKGVKKWHTCQVHYPMSQTRKVAFDLSYAHRSKLKSFLWAMIRNPEDRAINHFAMIEKDTKSELTAENFLSSLKHPYLPNIQLRFLNPLDTVGKDYSTYVKAILNEYNFVGVYERMHESLVVLSMLMDVDVTDVLYDFGGSSTSPCDSMERPKWVSSDVESYFTSSEWREQNKGDYILYDTINRSLDLTIERLGAENVQRKLTQFNKLLNIGTMTARKILGQHFGCGILGLHPILTPFADLKDLFWVKELSKEDKDFVSMSEFTTR